jgi:fructose-1,6-bisphosphatase/inositol monophosphatase family enzyme
MRPDGEAFVRALRPALRQAAAIARALEGRVRNRPKEGEASAAKAALTIADCAAQEAILVPLHDRFPGVRVAAEEDTPTVGRFPLRGEALVVVDPIDGTLRAYLDGAGPYAVMVGLAVGDRYEAALVALPREELFFDAVRGREAWLARGDSEPEPARLSPGGRRVMLSFEAPDALREALVARGFEVALGCGGAIAVAPCLPGFCAGVRVATGEHGLSPRGRIGCVIAEAAGARTASDRGAPFPPGLDDPARWLAVARDPSVLAELEAALAAAGVPTSPGSPVPRRPAAASR